VRSPDMTLCKEGTAKPSLPRSLSVELQSKKATDDKGSEGGCLDWAALLTQPDARRPPDAHVSVPLSPLSCLTARPHPNKPLYFNMKF
jgi:hypothetical protein